MLLVQIQPLWDLCVNMIGYTYNAYGATSSCITVVLHCYLRRCSLYLCLCMYVYLWNLMVWFCGSFRFRNIIRWLAIIVLFAARHLSKTLNKLLRKLTENKFICLKKRLNSETEMNEFNLGNITRSHTWVGGKTFAENLSD